MKVACHLRASGSRLGPGGTLTLLLDVVRVVGPFESDDEADEWVTNHPLDDPAEEWFITDLESM